ncbi:hypothetical protein JYU29_05870 [Tianweitania sp. BSSL-BM11]|uniref:Pyocin activator protein PrtN n=1 Tax=Tianweitania aestuarii TaxID=2814886 RepID=A0ABS5RT95_9HYPH|nr:hypothetical protein [Tianweitania aestuarii]MBS9720214.1 hypothetical protein [Tianweitania aestuarii]
MTAPAHHPKANSVRFTVQPRLVPALKAARFLHLSLLEFRDKLPALRKEGFPAPCPVTGHFDLVAMQTWQDRRSGLTGSEPQLEDHAAVMRQRIADLG